MRGWFSEQVSQSEIRRLSKSRPTVEIHFLDASSTPLPGCAALCCCAILVLASGSHTREPQGLLDASCGFIAFFVEKPQQHRRLRDERVEYEDEECKTKRKSQGK